MSKKVVVIGGGPGGYEAAIELAKLGAEVSLIEKAHLGGTCLNCGCIPTKTLLSGAETYATLKNADRFGIAVSDCKVDYARLYSRKEDVVKRLRNGVQFLMRKHGIQVVEGNASFSDKSHIAVDSGNKRSIIAFDAAIIATGSMPSMPPIPGIDGRNVMNSTDALELKELPERMAVIGGGVIGLELSAFFSKIGTKVTILEACPQILPEMDEDIAQEYLKLSGMSNSVKTSCKVQAIEDSATGKVVRYTDTTGMALSVECDKVLVATGRRAYTQGLNLEGIGVLTDRGRIQTNENYQTSVENVFAIGDVNGKAQFAHAATSQGRYAAQVIMGNKPTVKTSVVPWCVFTEPEMAGVGLSEKQAKKAGVAYEIAQFSFAASGKAMSMGKAEGFIKILYGPEYHEILGAKIVGPHATDLIGEMVLALSLETTLEELADTMHPHPTLCEALADAARQ